ncbi:MAG TPA: plastocyanin/azurin family copper-binding protein [Candidatus Acidoferrales bacterium]|nr:plastocyanin/azurin family copper-binding protein [Candidatus Acidoferrales bacterium]
MSQSLAETTSSLGRLGRFVTILTAAGLLAVARIAVPAFAAHANSPVVVKMTDVPAAFVPKKVTIKVGGEVEWENTGHNMHSVTANPPLPPGAESFDSGFMAPGATWIHKFTVPGTYHYLCIPHANSGMAGEVVVKK